MKAGDVMKVREGDEVILAWISMVGPKSRTQPTAKMTHAVVTRIDDRGYIFCKGKNIPNDSWSPESVHYHVDEAKEHLRLKIAGFIRQWEAVLHSIDDLEVRP